MSYMQSKGVTSKFRLGSPPLNLSCLSSNPLLSEWQTPGVLHIWRKPCTYLAPTLTLSLNRPKRDSTWPTSPSSSIRCIQNNFWASSMFSTNRAAILRQGKHNLQTDWIELPFEPHHLGVPSGVSKTISEPMVRLAQTVHLSCTDTSAVSKWSKMRFYKTHVT
jgi:hypothetical protein